jgi:phenylpropionate dioxygenase-like ring-hydroxylating dioxygenase large terminal subunit
MTLTNTHPSLRNFWHPVALESDVTGDGPFAVALLGERWVLARLHGELVAMQDRCPHRFVPLSAGRVVGDELECAYHGYRFGADGKVTRIPSLSPDVPIPPKACVKTANVREGFGLIWLCLADEPLDGLLDDAAYRDPTYDVFFAGPFTTRVSAGVLADNFLDSAHFPFLHAATFGASDPGTPSLTVRRDGWRIHQLDTQVVDGAHLDAPVTSHAVYEVAAPFSVLLRLDRPDGSDHIWSFACPVDDDTTIWYMVHAYPLGGDTALIDASRDLQVAVGLEDLGILERMEDPNVQLDIRAELHTKADLGTLEYRRMLAELATLSAAEGRPVTVTT